MMFRFHVLQIGLALGLVSPAVATEPTPLPVGVMADPCASLPRLPKVAAEYLAASVREKVDQEPAPDGLAAYQAWQQSRLATDFPNLCRYEAANRGLPAPSKHRIVFIGDSITEAWRGTRPDFFKGDRIGRGISGQTTAQMIGRFQADVIALRPATVHILAGTNDVAGNTGPTDLGRIQANIRTMVELAKAHHIRVLLGTVLPTTKFNWRPEIEPVASIKALNDWLRAYAKEQHVTIVDYYTALDDGRSGLTESDSKDGVHPTASAYAKMEVVFEKALASAPR